MTTTQESAGAGPAGVLRVLQSKEEVRSFYNKIGRFYDLLAEQSEGPVRQKALAALNVQPGEKALEIGYGTGHCLVALAQAVGPSGRVYGVDLSDAMMQIAEENLDRAGVADRAELLCGDATRLPYEDGALDAIFMSFTLELFDTPEIPVVLAECRRTLRRGGRLGVASLTKDTNEGMAERIYEWTHRHFPNLLDCRPIFVRQEIEAAGFRVENAERVMMWVPVEIVLAVNP
jgi:demethylmenaquinone methyltransferase/2-methoxy-6-polyprenyl-1,4-benzoquinol methylase